jgi:hypothetical protein
MVTTNRTETGDMKESFCKNNQKELKDKTIEKPSIDINFTGIL